jgi:CubicO group peptidase (beta-lactamase class C family)
VRLTTLRALSALLVLLPGVVTKTVSAAQPETPGGGKPILRYGTPRQAGLLDYWIDRIDEEVEAGLQPSPDLPRYPGAVVIAGRNGVIAKHGAYGYAYKYSDDAPTLLPEADRLPMRKDTIFDLASVSKLFTSIAVMQLVEDDRIDLGAPVASYIPAFGRNGKASITVEMLLTHTGGLAAWLPLYRDYPSQQERIEAIYDSAPEYAPGTDYVYSDLGLIVLGELVETVGGVSLDEHVRVHITEPLGMRDTGYNPAPSKLARIAATEYQPWAGRGMIRGSVHDENAWSLAGVAGHAGVFGTGYDLAVLAQTFLNGGRYGDARVLDRDSVELMFTNYNTEFPGNDHGLGFELNQHWYMDAMATPTTAGHTGFTGTSMVLNPLDDSFAILLTNRVHPSREWGTVNPYRRSVARAVGRAVPVRPAEGKDAWYSGIGDELHHTLDLPLSLPQGAKRLKLDLWYDTEPASDFATVAVSNDGGETWSPLPGVLRAPGEEPSATDGTVSGWSEREWLNGTFPLDDYQGSVTLRFSYASDALYSGRGVYVDDVRIKSARGILFDDSRRRDRDAFVADGWLLSRN